MSCSDKTTYVFSTGERVRFSGTTYKGENYSIYIYDSIATLSVDVDSGIVDFYNYRVIEKKRRKVYLDSIGSSSIVPFQGEEFE